MEDNEDLNLEILDRCWLCQPCKKSWLNPIGIFVNIVGEEVALTICFILGIICLTLLLFAP